MEIFPGTRVLKYFIKGISPCPFETYVLCELLERMAFEQQEVDSQEKCFVHSSKERYSCTKRKILLGPLQSAVITLIRIRICCHNKLYSQPSHDSVDYYSIYLTHTLVAELGGSDLS